MNPHAEKVTVVAIPNYFRVSEKIFRSFPAGHSIREILIDLGLHGHDEFLNVQLEGMHIETAFFDKLRPKPGTTILIRVLPAGKKKEGKNILSTIITIAGLIMTQNLGPSFAKRLGLSGAKGLAIGTAVAGFAVTFALQALIPPPKQSLPKGISATADPEQYSITGAGNTANHYGPIPRVYGRIKMYPPLAAKPYTEIIDGDQFLIMVFCLGYIEDDSDLIVSSIKIGNTAISNFNDVELEYQTSVQRMPPAQKAIFGADVDEVSVSQVLAFNSWETQTTSSNTIGISVDISALGGLTLFNSDGSRSTRSVDLEIEYAVSGSGNWIPFIFDAEAGDWGSIASLPAARYDAACASVGGKIYIIGGYDGSNYLATVLEYDPALDTYTAKASLSAGLRNATAATDGTNIYVFGGRVTGGTATDQVAIYNVSGNSWSYSSGANTAWGQTVVPILSNAFLCFGGFDGTNYLATARMYTIGSGFTALSFGAGFSAIASAFSAGIASYQASKSFTVYLVGGTTTAGAEVTTIRAISGDLRNSPISLSFAVKATQNITGFSQPASTTLQNDLIIIQGTEVVKFSTSSMFLTALEDLGTSRTNTIAGSADGVIYVFGGLGTQASAASQQQKITMSANVATVYRRTFKKLGLTAATYDVRIRRTTADSAADNDRNELTWTAIRSFQDSDSVVFENCKTLAMRVKASGQLNGVIDTLNCTVEAVLPVWNGSSFVRTQTRNPAWALVDVLRGAANKSPIADSKINLTAIKTWADNCDTAGRYFDTVFDSFSTMFDVLQDIAAAGRASFAIIDGKYTVVEDKTQTTAIQMFTPRNSFNFSGKKSFQEIPHAIKIRFRNEDADYDQDERIVYDDGYDSSTATLFSEIDLPGVTDPDQAWKMGRYYLACARLRPETFTLSCDVENLVCTRGDLVRLAHDVTLISLGFGRINSLTANGSNHVTQIVLDAFLTVNGSTNYTIRIRGENGTIYSATVQANSAGSGIEEDTFDVQSPSASLTTAMIETGDLCALGVSGSETMQCLVKNISYGEDLTATLTLVPYDAAIYTADSGSIPAYDSKLTLPITVKQEKPPLPELLNIRSDEYALVRSIDGSFQPSILITLKPLSVTRQDPPERIEAIYRRSGDSRSQWSTAQAEAASLQIRLENVEKGVSYWGYVRYVSRYGVASEWLSPSGFTFASPHSVVGKSSAPSDITDLATTARDFGIELSWSEIADPDKDLYEIRLGATWATATLLAQIRGDRWVDKMPGTGSRTYSIKAIDTSGNYSTTADTASITITAPSVATPTATLDGLGNVVIAWSPTAGTFPIYDYDLRFGTTATAWADATVILKTKGLKYVHKVDFSGTRRFWVTAYDAATNASSSVYVDLAISAPSSVSFEYQVLRSTVILTWAAPSASLPIKFYRIYRGASFGSATLLQQVDGTIATITESSAGTYNYWIVAVDTANNVSTESSQTIIVDAPADYIFYDSQTSDYSAGTVSNVLRLDGFVIPLFDTTQTYQEHFDDNGATSMQDLIDDGWAYWLEPVLSDASYEEVFDMIGAAGSIIGSRIRVTISRTVIDQAPTHVCTISVSDTSATGPWTDFIGVEETFATDFRWVKITLEWAAADNANGRKLADYTALQVRVDAEKIDDGGYIESTDPAWSAGAITVNFNKTFIDIQSLTATPVGSGATDVIVVIDPAVFATASPTSFTVRGFRRDTGAATAVPFSWTAMGV